MVNEINVEYMGEDSWGRKVYRNIQNKRYYKDICSSNYPGRLFTSDGFEGEPDCPLREDVNIIIINK